MLASYLKNKGFTLLEVIIVLGLLGGISLFVMQLFKNISTGQVNLVSFADYMSLRDEISFLIKNPNSCQASLNGMTFNGDSIKDTPKTGIEIWSADQTGARSKKKFYAGSKFGKVKIDQISLNMPDYTAGVNFPIGTNQSSPAQLKIEGDKTIMGSSKPFPDITISLNLTFDTDASGISTIKGCSQSVTASFLTTCFDVPPDRTIRPLCGSVGDNYYPEPDCPVGSVKVGISKIERYVDDCNNWSLNVRYRTHTKCCPL